MPNDNIENEVINNIIYYQNNKKINPLLSEKKLIAAIETSKKHKITNLFISATVLLAEYNYEHNKIETAIVLYRSIENEAVRLNDKDALSKIYTNLADLYLEQNETKNLEISKSYFKKSNLINNKNETKYKNYYYLAYIDFISKNFVGSLNNLENCIKLSNKNIYNLNSKIYQLRAKNYLEINNYELALINIHISKNIKNKTFEDNINDTILYAEYFLKKKNFDKSISLLNKIESNNNLNTNQKIAIYDLMYNNYINSNQKEKSLNYLEQSKNLNEKLFKLNRDKATDNIVNELNSINKLKELQNQNEISKLKTQKSRYFTYTLISILLVIILILLLLWYQNKIAKTRIINQNIKINDEISEIQQKILRTQLNPHFMSNALSAIQSKIYLNEKEISVNYISKFSQLMRYILETSNKDLVPLNKEIMHLENYILLQKLLLEEKLQYEINIDKNLNIDDYNILPMLLQPLVENAIVHGIDPMNIEGKLTININDYNENIQFEIIDNGLGIENTKKLNDKKSNKLSFSTNITQDRIKLFNKKNNSTITVISKQIEENNLILGTKVTVVFPKFADFY